MFRAVGQDMDKMKMTACFRNKVRKNVLGAALGVCALMGSAEAAERAFTFAVPGVVAKVLVAPGDMVKAGQTIAQLDGSLYKADLAAAEAVMQAAEASLQRAEADATLVQTLYDDLSASGEELDDANDTVNAAEAALAVAQANATKAAWRLMRTTLDSPESGKVVSIPGFAGQVVDPSNPQAVVILE